MWKILRNWLNYKPNKRRSSKKRLRALKSLKFPYTRVSLIKCTRPQCWSQTKNSRYLWLVLFLCNGIDAWILQYFLVAAVWDEQSNENQLHIQQQIFVLFNSLDKAFRNIIMHTIFVINSNEHSKYFLQKLNFDNFLQTLDFFVLFVDFNLSLAMD